MIKKILRVFITLISLAFLLWFLAPFIKFGILNPGNILGIGICLYLILRFGFHRLYNSIKEFFHKRKFTRFIWCLFNIILSVFAVYAVIATSLIIGFSLNAPNPDSSATAIVLGAEVKPWGPSAMLQQRINAADEYLKANPKAVAVATGGKGSDEIMSEAQCIYENLSAKNIDKNRIFIEDKATNTWENIKFSKRIIEENNLNKDIVIVSDGYHQFRTRIIARRQGIGTNISAVNSKINFAEFLCYPTMVVREWIAIPVTLLK